jgi:membrane protease YdiL (CAAX protease family)
VLCFSLKSFVRLLGVMLIILTLVTFLATLFQLQGEYPGKAILPFTFFCIYLVPALAFLIMTASKEDIRARKRFHCAYLCSVISNTLIRLFLVLMVVTFCLSYYIFVVNEQAGTEGFPETAEGTMSIWAILFIGVAMLAELAIETLIRM